MSSDAEKAQTRAALVGVWNVNAGGMTSVVVLDDGGSYSNTLTGGMQGHAGTWSVVDAYGAQCIYFKLESSYPKEFVGPLATVPIQWPATETWGITNVHPNQIGLFGGGVMYRAQPLSDAASGNVPPPEPHVESIYSMMSRLFKT